MLMYIFRRWKSPQLFVKSFENTNARLNMRSIWFSGTPISSISTKTYISKPVIVLASASPNRLKLLRQVVSINKIQENFSIL